nr:MAG TPA: hypothetical protein [Caudoviricetes sp.]
MFTYKLIIKAFISTIFSSFSLSPFPFNLV